MDPFEAYKDKIGTRIASIIGESLLQLRITEEEAEQMGKYVLDNIDLAKTNSELLDFVTNLSTKWPIFNSILTSPDPAPVNASPSAQTQGKTEEAVHTAEELIKENKIEEALRVTKAAENPPNQTPPGGPGGGI